MTSRYSRHKAYMLAYYEKSACKPNSVVSLVKSQQEYPRIHKHSLEMKFVYEELRLAEN